ncbi:MULTISPECIES: hypothetical protein [Sphingobacterium]|uniref:hypothetical protein n=1 Tax=Sphingobacterium TaxID=28453 RepID=UPI0008A1BBE8|nr:hypothetical protein [Sphingobacterium sp. HMSC13C05]
MEKKKRTLNAFGQYLEKRSVNKAQVCKRTGIHPTRMTWLCYAPVLYLRSNELQLISLAINVEACQMQKDLFGNLTLKEEFTPSEQLINNISKLLSENNLINKNKISDKDIERIALILPFCIDEKNESEILALLGLKRRSSRLITSLKVCIEVGLLTLHKKNSEGTIVSEYALTELGKQITEGL